MKTALLSLKERVTYCTLPLKLRLGVPVTSSDLYKDTLEMKESCMQSLKTIESLDGILSKPLALLVT